MAVLDDSVRAQLVALLPRLRRFARGLAGTADQADDLVQAACERALNRIAQWTPGTRLDSWMFRIVQTIWWNELRARKVRELHVHREQVWQPRLNYGEADGQLLLVRAEQEIFRLPEPLRVVLLLVCVGELSYREAAEVASIPIGTVMSRLARARLLLMQRLGLDGELVGPADGKASDTLPVSDANLLSPTPASNRPKRRTRKATAASIESEKR